MDSPNIYLDGTGTVPGSPAGYAFYVNDSGNQSNLHILNPLISSAYTLTNFAYFNAGSGINSSISVCGVQGNYGATAYPVINNVNNSHVDRCPYPFGANAAPWSSATMYPIGAMVSSGGVIYRAIASNTNATPASNPADWVVDNGAVDNYSNAQQTNDSALNSGSSAVHWQIQRGQVGRWNFRTQDNETGSNAGSNLYISPLNDNGSTNFDLMVMTRAAGGGVLFNGPTLSSYYFSAPSLNTNPSVSNYIGSISGTATCSMGLQGIQKIVTCGFINWADNTVVSTTGTASNGSTVLTVALGTGIVPGALVAGTNIAANTRVVTVSGTTVNLSIATTGVLSSTAVTFTGQSFVFPAGFSNSPIISESNGSCGAQNPTTTMYVISLPAASGMTGEYCGVKVDGQ
jgi:hypothetical protein